MVTQRAHTDARRLDVLGSSPPTTPDVRSRWSGIVPSLLMALVVAGPSTWLTWRILASWFVGEKASHIQISLFLLPTVLLVGLLLIPSLLIGRWPGRMTAIPGLIWLTVAALLFIVPSLGLASVRAVERPDTVLADESSSTINWEFGLPDGSSVIAALFGALLILGIGYLVGHWARGISRAAVIVAVPVATFLWLLALAMYLFASLGRSLGAQSEPSPDTGLLGLLPFVTWIAAPAVAVLAGAELWAEEDLR